MSLDLEQLVDRKQHQRLGLISVVLPVFNEAGCLAGVVSELCTYLAERWPSYRFEISFIDDRSTDGSFEILAALARTSPENVRISVLRLARNSGSHVAITAGLNIARGDFVVIMASDGQDPAGVIGDLIVEWENGCETVTAARAKNLDHGRIGQWLSDMAWRAMIWSTGITDMPASGCDVLGLDRKVVEAFNRMDERNTTFVFRLLSLGFRQKQIEYVKRARTSGQSKWTFFRKISIMLDAMTGYTNRPLRLVTKAGFVLSLALLVRWAVVMVRAYGFGVQPTDVTVILNSIFTSLAVVVILLGVIGDYIWRVLDESRKRPPYEISDVEGKVFEK